MCRVLLVILCVSCALAQSQQPVIGNAQDFATLAQQAVELQRSGNNEAAAAAYRNLLKLDPNQVATHVNLAIVLVNLGQFDEAISEYQAGERLAPNDPRIAMNLALAYEKSGRLEEARQRFGALHAAYPDEIKITQLLADCDLQLGDNSGVIQLLQPVAAQNTEDLGFSYMLGMALLHEHRIEEGQVYLDRILKNGDTAETRFLLGTRMFESGDYPAALKQLASASEMNPKLPQLQSLYGRALLITGDPDGAVEAFRKALAINVKDYEANIGLAQIDDLRNNFVEAAALARTALSLRPQSIEASLLLAESLVGLGQVAQARPYAEAAATALPNSADAHRTLASVYNGLHDPVQAAREEGVVQKLDEAAMAAEPGPRPNEGAPDFSLPLVGSSSSVSLHDYRGKSPVVLVFGSYTCPNFRDSANALKAMQARYGKSIPFLLVYIREAHATGDWQSTRNLREHVDLKPAVDLGEKRDHAMLCSRTLHLTFPAVVDGMDNAVEAKYNAWPSRAFIIDVSGRVLYSTRLTEFDFHAGEMEAVLRKLVSPSKSASVKRSK